MATLTKRILFPQPPVALLALALTAILALPSDTAANGRYGAGNEIAIIYGGNSQGVIVPYPPSDDAIGGLSRYATVIMRLRRAHKHSNISIDAGNIVNAGSDDLRLKLGAAYYDYMRFDAIAPGSGEAAAGLEKFVALNKTGAPFVVSGMRFPEASGISSHRVVTVGKKRKTQYNVFVINVLCPSVLDGRSSNVNTLRKILADSAAVNARLRIAVVHGKISEIKKIAAALPDLDIIIAGSLDQRFNTPLKQGNTHILSAGSEHKFVGCFLVRFDGSGNIKRTAATHNALYPIFQDIKPNPNVEDLVRRVSAYTPIDKGKAGYRAMHMRGVIPFVSERDGDRRVYLKAVETQREYTLSEEADIHPRNPILAQAGNRAAFIYGAPDALYGRLKIVDLAKMEGVEVLPNKNVMDAAFDPVSDFIYVIGADSGKDRGAIYMTKMRMGDAINILPRGNTPRRELSVSPDGRSIFFCSPRDGFWHIFKADLNDTIGKPPTRITTQNANHRYPRMSRDGRYIAYMSDNGTFRDGMELWIYDMRKGEHRQLTRNTNVHDFCWKDDARTIFFSSGINMLDIHGVNVRDEQAGIRKMVLTAGDKNWSETAPRFIRYKGQPKIVYAREYANGARRLHWVDTRTRRDSELFILGDWDEWLE